MLPVWCCRTRKLLFVYFYLLFFFWGGGRYCVIHTCFRFFNNICQTVHKVDPGLASKVKEGTVFRIGYEGSFGQRHTTPRTLNSNHLCQLVCVEGIATKVSLVRPKVSSILGKFCTGRLCAVVIFPHFVLRWFAPSTTVQKLIKLSAGNIAMLHPSLAFLLAQRIQPKMTRVSAMQTLIFSDNELTLTRYVVNLCGQETRCKQSLD